MIGREMTASPLPPDWPSLSDEQLLDVRMCDLPLQIDGTVMEERIAELTRELQERGLTFAIRFYLSDEWFTPDGMSAIAIPFYLAHPRLEKLEEAQMLEVEGGEHEWCMRILRHEAGHALDNAYRLRLRRRRRELFGSPSEPYPEFYTPKPYSKSYVLHLDSWYAQSHPDEDFAETFAVWLTPNGNWEQRYAGWPALKKLEYIDQLMRSAGGDSRPPSIGRSEVEPLASLRQTLRQHYRRKRRHYGVDHPAFYDRDLRRLFSDAPEFAGEHHRRAVPRADAAAAPAARRQLDGHLPVHDRPGARGHHPAVPRAEAAPRGVRKTRPARSSPSCSRCRR